VVVLDAVVGGLGVVAVRGGLIRPGFDGCWWT
jgi:hypothetical protein